MFITPMIPLGELNGLKPLAEEKPVSGESSLFKDIFETAIENLKETEIDSNNNTTPLALGEIDDLHTLGIDATKAYLAERLVIEMRNRAMDAYSELMRMSI